jgi:uncharacterized membrane protein
MARRRNDPILLTAAGLGALAGLRSMSAPALLSHELAEDGVARGRHRLERVLSSPVTARLLALFAGGEMLADKTSLVGSRIAPLPLAGRAVIGSLTAATFAMNRRQGLVAPAMIGAAAAVAATYAAFHLRRLAGERLGVPDQFLGMIEDALVVAAGKGIAEFMEND